MRTHYKSSTTILLISFLLSSCFSTLKVKVDVLDMKKLYESSEYRDANQKIELESYNQRLNGNYFPDLEKTILEQIKTAISEDTSFDRNSITPTLNSVGSDLRKYLNTLQSSMNSLRSKLQSKMAANSKTNTDAYGKELANYLNQKDAFSVYLTKLLPEAGVTDRTIVDEFSRFGQGVVKSISVIGIYGVRITDDKMASFVAKAPEPYWQKYKPEFYDDETNTSKSKYNSRINETRITTFIGNSDIAVKMDGPGNFVIKGVRLDADQAFRTSFKVLSQGIQHYAQNFKLRTAPAETAVSSGLNNYAVNLATVKRLQQEQANNTKIFMEVLDTYKSDLQSPDPTIRANAVKILKEAYDFYQSHLTQ